MSMAASWLKTCFRLRCSVTDLASPGPSALSLHDALPISAAAVDAERLLVDDVHPLLRDPVLLAVGRPLVARLQPWLNGLELDRKSTRLNSSHLGISYAVFCLKKKKEPLEIVRNSNNIDSQ